MYTLYSVQHVLSLKGSKDLGTIGSGFGYHTGSNVSGGSQLHEVLELWNRDRDITLESGVFSRIPRNRSETHA
ncbi:hypothetical protein N7501_009106 [Penicillium viridicatum]|nr:hypothetical protein N7501_009106 [Penicillium viridicatum]